MKLTVRYLMIAVVLLALAPRAASADEFDDLAREFWQWRAVHQPLSTDDIPRIDRPAEWTPDWSAATIAKRRQSLVEFEQRWKRINATTWPVTRQVDYRLIGSAIARVRWELEVTREWQRNPRFYLSQTLGAIFDRLLQPPPIDGARSFEILRRLQSIPRTVEDAKRNLSQPVAPFAKLAIDELKDVESNLSIVAREIKPLLTIESAAWLGDATLKAIIALEAYREWLQQGLASMPAKTAVGRDAYLYFLRRVALMPFTPEQLLDMGRQEWERAVAFEAYEQNRNQGLPQLPLFPDQAAQMAREAEQEKAIRRFLEEKNILTVPAWMRHYRNLPLPAYLAALPGPGVTDDLTGPNRLKEDGVSYIREPSPNLGYFGLPTARDPRPIIVHEGVPGHYFQMALSWAHENRLRRHYYDSGANEGIGFYAEEMMLQAGLFDDSPRTREIIYNFMRLRALRVEVDVKLATGLFTIDQAAEYLQRTVPMDGHTALEEAAFFAASPGQAITYQIGKLQIIRFLADARRTQGDKFNLRAFHDYVWKNGNMPLSLQRWEYLGLRDEIETIDQYQENKIRS
jgi:uncharacterized protein (DUF885 family)